MNPVSRVSLRIPCLSTPWEALLVTAVNAGCLWWFTWLQMVTVWFFGVPGWSFHLSSVWALQYYRPVDPFRLSVPELFLTISCGLTVLSIGLTIRSAWGKPGGARMIFVVCLFGGLMCGFAGTVLKWRTLHLEQLEGTIRYLDRELQERAEDPEWIEFLRAQQKQCRDELEWQRKDLRRD